MAAALQMKARTMTTSSGPYWMLCAGREDVRAFVICDHRTIRRYGLGAARPSPLPIFPDVRSGYLKTGRTVRELASSAGINPENLERTIDEVNRDAGEERDRAFGGGDMS